jgi:hypothetical protein
MAGQNRHMVEKEHTSRTLPLAVGVVPVAGRRGTCKIMCCDKKPNIGSACDMNKRIPFQFVRNTDHGSLLYYSIE